MKLKTLIGSGSKIGLFVLPFLIVGIGLNIMFPAIFSVGGPPPVLWLIALIMFIPGVIIWIWSVFLIITRVSRGQLITNGPYAFVKHPLYTGVSLLVLPSVGFFLNSWLGVLLGIILYIGSRKYAPEEEMVLSQMFGTAWSDYSRSVIIPWL